MEQDSFRFLRPWTQLLPPAGSAVVAVVGSGACTTVTLRLVQVYREQGARVLVTHTVDRAVPFALADVRCEPSAEAVRAALDEHGMAYVAGPGDTRAAAIAPDTVDRLARDAGADVVVVEAGTPSGGRLRRGPDAPVWPRDVRLAVVVGQLGLVGRPWGPRAVEGVDDVRTVDGEVRRVGSADVVRGVERALGTVPDGVRALPFLAGFGAYRDLDGMFAAVESLLDPPARPVLCFGELLGDERRDAADRRGTEHAVESPWIDDERVYAVYPAALDEE